MLSTFPVLLLKSVDIRMARYSRTQAEDITLTTNVAKGKIVDWEIPPFEVQTTFLFCFSFCVCVDEGFILG